MRLKGLVLSLWSLLTGAILTPLAAAESPKEMPPPSVSSASPGPTWTVQVDPLTFALGLAHVQVERRLGPHFSFYVGPNCRLFDGLLDATHQPYLGIGIEAGARRFFSRKAPQGAWVGARGVIAVLHTEEPEVLTSVGGYGSVLGGYTWIIHDTWVLSGGLGVQYISYHVGAYGFGGLFPAAHTALGIAF